MKIEDRVKKAVEYGLAGRPSDLGSWESLQRRARVERRWRIAATALGTAAVIAVGVVVGPKLLGDRETPPPSFTSPTVPSSVAAPDAIVAIDRAGAVDGDERIVVIDTATGRVLRELARASGEGENVVSFGPSLALTPDGKTLYFVKNGPGLCRGSVMSVPVAGGNAREVAPGAAMALSPDGRRLAFVERGTQPNCGVRPDLVVRDLATGVERRWDWAGEDPNNVYEQGGPNKLAWATDGRYLTFERNVGDPLGQVWVLDTTSGKTLLDAIKITPEKKAWESPTYLAPDRLAILEVVRSIHDQNGVSGRILAVDPRDGRILGERRGEVDGLVHIDADASGDHVVLATERGLFRLDGVRLIPVANGAYDAAAW